jgi:hypothetical protein
METLNKLAVASEMFVEAHNRYVAARRNIDYIVSIMLSGAVVGIVSPLLKEQGGHTTHSVLARFFSFIAGPNGPAHEGMFRNPYNALKHTGDHRLDIAPSSDLENDMELRTEAANMLNAARNDFRQLDVAAEVRSTFPPGFALLLESTDSYA